jgi:hypothetical protein
MGEKLGASAKTGHGVHLYTEVRDAAGQEIADTHCHANGLMHHISARWRFKTRPGDFKVHAALSKKGLATYTGPSSVYEFHIQNASSRFPYTTDRPIVLTGAVGQEILSCIDIEVLDDWTNTYDLEVHASAQVPLDIHM